MLPLRKLYTNLQWHPTRYPGVDLVTSALEGFQSDRSFCEHCEQKLGFLIWTPCSWNNCVPLWIRLKHHFTRHFPWINIVCPWYCFMHIDISSWSFALGFNNAHANKKAWGFPYRLIIAKAGPAPWGDMHTLYQYTSHLLITLNMIKYSSEEETNHGKHCPQALQNWWPEKRRESIPE